MTGKHFLCAVFALIALPAMAQETQPVELLQAQQRAVIDTLVASDTVSEAQIRWNSLLLADDLDGIPGLSERDLLIRGAIRDARLRAGRVAQQLRFDLNGDLSITRDELLPFERASAMGPIRNGTRMIAPTDVQAEEIARQMVERRLLADTSGDGILTLQELLAEPLKKYVALSELYDPSRAPFASLLDGDGDGTVTEAEFMVPLLAAADRMDTNGDGIISLIEKQQRADRPVPKTARQKQDRALMDALMPRRVCDLAPKSADAQVLVLGGYEGAALSNIVFGSEEQPAYVVDLVIPSQQPSRA